MPVDKKILERCIQETAEGDAEFADYLRKKYEANDSLAARFVGGFMRTDDYTRKSQELAEQRRSLGDQSSQVENLRKSLEEAESEKNKIMRELAERRISTAKASELMSILQDKYALTDEDLPGMSDFVATAKKGKVVDSTDPLDDRFAKFKAEVMAEAEKKFTGAMIPELGAMAALPLIWSEISREHQELTGKPLTFAEQQEILKDARAGKGGIRDVWEEKYQISGDSGLRMKKRDERLQEQWKSDWEKKQADQRSKDALNVVTPAAREMGDGPGISTAFKTKFRTFEMDPNKQPVPQSDGVPVLKVEPGQHVRQSGDRGPSAAQRAAAKFIEKGGAAGYARKAS